MGVQAVSKRKSTSTTRLEKKFVTKQKKFRAYRAQYRVNR